MLRLSFDKFVERLDYERLNRFPVVHFVETELEFRLYFKNVEYWEYFTVVSKADIERFGSEFGVGSVDSLADFRLEYLNGAVELEDESVVVDNKPINSIDKNKDSLTLYKEQVDAGEDVIAESESYEDFFVEQINIWEEKVLNALDRVNKLKSFESTKKTFGEFVERLFNVINASKFIGKVGGYVRKGMNAGLESAENELNVDVGFTTEFQRRKSEVTYQQIEGYTISGKKWFGIKGATKDLRVKILKTVDDALRDGKNMSEVAKDVKKVFSTAKNSQAVRIARTETNRFINEGKILTYKESGVSGRKAWVAMLDDRTADVCKFLHNKYNSEGVGFDENFYNDNTGKEWFNPPQHPNCRCTVEFRLEKKKNDNGG